MLMAYLITVKNCFKFSRSGEKLVSRPGDEHRIKVFLLDGLLITGINFPLMWNFQNPLTTSKTIFWGSNMTIFKMETTGNYRTKFSIGYRIQTETNMWHSLQTTLCLLEGVILTPVLPWVNFMYISFFYSNNDKKLVLIRVMRVYIASA